MKKIKYVIIMPLITLLLGFLVQSCEKDLTSKNFSSLTPDNFFNSETDLQVATVALYYPFTIDWGGLYNGNSQNYNAAQEVTTDETYPYWRNPYELIYSDFLIQSSTFTSDGSVYGIIRFIAKATDVIDKIQKCKVSENVKKEYIAEAKAVRAFLSYILYDLYGPVNGIYDPTKLSSLDPLPRPDADTYKKQMIDDLTEAIPDLVEKTNGTSDWGRFNRNAARAVLMRIYLNDKQWGKAIAVCTDIETNGNYTLMTDYKDVFNISGNNEIIYASSATSKIPNYYPTCAINGDLKEANGGLITTPPAGGWNVMKMPWAYYDKYQAGDKRLLTIVAEYTNVNDELITRESSIMSLGAMPLKFTDLSKPSGSGYLLDQPIFRLAEVYLSHAEALNELNGPTAEAISFAQKITDRAGTTIPVAAKNTKAGFRDFLLDERGRELYNELVRRTDLIRHGKFISGANTRGINAKDYQVVYPIPSDAILQSKGVIEQNAGY